MELMSNVYLGDFDESEDYDCGGVGFDGMHDKLGNWKWLLVAS